MRSDQRGDTSRALHCDEHLGAEFDENEHVTREEWERISGDPTPVDARAREPRDVSLDLLIAEVLEGFGELVRL